MKRTLHQVALGFKPSKSKAKGGSGGSSNINTNAASRKIEYLDIETFKPVALTDSASVIVLRRSPPISRAGYDGSPEWRKQYQVLMVTKTKRVDFGGSTVFPGGLTEGGLDYRFAEYIQFRRNQLLSKSGNDSTITNSTIRDTSNNTELLHFRINALRELFEETGILLAQSASDDMNELILESKGERNRYEARAVNDGDQQSIMEEWRKRVVNDAINFELMCRDQDLIPCVNQLQYWMRLQTPVNTYRRWDTHFYICLLNDRDSLNLNYSALGREINHIEWLDLDWDSTISVSKTIPVPTRLILQELCKISDESKLEYELQNAHVIRHVYPIRPKAVIVTRFEEAEESKEKDVETNRSDNNNVHPRDVRSMILWDSDDSYHLLDLKGGAIEDANDFECTQKKRVRTVQYKNKKFGLNGCGFDTIINVPRLYPYSQLPSKSKL